jgi:hypothetical protein
MIACRERRYAPIRSAFLRNPLIHTGSIDRFNWPHTERAPRFSQIAVRPQRLLLVAPQQSHLLSYKDMFI